MKKVLAALLFIILLFSFACAESVNLVDESLGKFNEACGIIHPPP